LASKLYQHALFPRWPKLKEVNKNCRGVLNETRGSSYSPEDLFSFLAWRKDGNETEIKKNLCGDFSDFLDPSDATGPMSLGVEGVTVEFIEEMFSYSVAQGFEKIKETLSPIEKLVLAWLVGAEKTLDEVHIKAGLVREAETVKAVLRNFACRFAKRGLGVRSGAVKEADILSKYKEAVFNQNELNQARKAFQNILNDNSRFSISVMNTFGQPIPSPAKDVLLRGEVIKVGFTAVDSSPNKPKTYLPFLQAHEYPIPLTYPLYKALYQVGQGLYRPSLPSEILALLEGTRAKIAGLLVHDQNWLEDVVIDIGDTGEKLVVEMGDVIVKKGSTNDL
jgi:hypothetical protein